MEKWFILITQYHCAKLLYVAEGNLISKNIWPQLPCFDVDTMREVMTVTGLAPESAGSRVSTAVLALASQAGLFCLFFFQLGTEPFFRNEV